MPAKNTKRISLDLYPDDVARLELAAARQKTSFAAVLRSLLLQHTKLPTFEEWLHLNGHSRLATTDYSALCHEDQTFWYDMKRQYSGVIARFR